MNFFNQGIPLGRWFRITVIIHWTFLIYAANELFGTGRGQGQFLAFNAMSLGLLFGTVLLHEFGHALSCRAVGGEAHQIILWPLGGIAFVQPPMNPFAWLVTTACGPLVNLVLWPIFYLVSRYLIVSKYGVDVWDYVLSVQGGNRMVIFGDVSMPVQACLFMWQINKGLLLFNLIPAYPMDGGRLLQEILWFFIGYGKSLMVAGMVGTVAGVCFIIIGLGLQEVRIPYIDFQLGQKGHVNTMLAIIGLLAAMQSFTIYRRSQEISTWRKN